MKKYLIILFAVVMLLLAACLPVQQGSDATQAPTQTTMPTPTPTTQPTETTMPTETSVPTETTQPTESIPPTETTMPTETVQSTETSAPTEPQGAATDPYGYPFIFDGSNPSMQNDADISECVEGYLYWFNINDKSIFFVTDKKVVQKENMVSLFAANETHVYFVTEEEPTKIYAAPLEDFSVQEVIYESEHGNIDRIMTGDFQYENTTLQITEGASRFVWFDLTEKKAELFMEQYFLLSACIETMDCTAEDENGEEYLVDCNKIFFFGKLSAEDTEVKSYHYYRDTGEVVEFDYQ